METQKLIELISQSLLPAAEKKEWINIVPDLAEEYIPILINILEDAQKQIQMIKENEQKKIEEINKKYLEILDDFKRTKLSVARKEVENKERTEEDQKTQNLLRNI